MMEANEYDLVVIGSGPAGQKAAICAAKMRWIGALVCDPSHARLSKLGGSLGFPPVCK